MSRERRPPPSPPPRAEPAAAPRPAPAARRRPLALLLAAAAALAVTVWVVSRPPPLPLPDPAALGLDGDPAVAEVLAEDIAAIRRTPDAASAWGTLGFHLAALGRDAAAADCFRAAAARDTRSWRWPSLAGFATVREAPAEAEALFGEGVRRDGRALWPRLGRAEARLELGRFDAAREDFEAILALEPGQPRACLGAARCLLAGGDGAAADALGPALDHPATRRASRLVAAQSLARTGDTAGARARLAEAEALPEDDPWSDDPLTAELPRHTLGKQGLIALLKGLEATGDAARAESVSRRLEETYPEVWFLLEGRLRAARGDAAEAERAFRRAIEIDPRAAEVHWDLAGLLAARGRTDDAVAAYRELVRLEPTHGPGWLALGRLLLTTDRAGAVAALRRATDCMPASEEARRALADAATGEKGSDPP